MSAATRRYGDNNMNVLILSAKTGGGHLRCAQALEKVITDLDPFGSVRIVDGLEYVNRYFNKFVVNGYKFSARISLQKALAKLVICSPSTPSVLAGFSPIVSQSKTSGSVTS